MWSDRILEARSMSAHSKFNIRPVCLYKLAPSEQNLTGQDPTPGPSSVLPHVGMCLGIGVFVNPHSPTHKSVGGHLAR